MRGSWGFLYSAFASRARWFLVGAAPVAADQFAGKLFLAINGDPKLVNKEGWNKIVVRAEGDRHVIHLNGTQVADVRDGDSRSGHIGFQIHAGSEFAKMRVIVKEVRVRKL